EVGASAPPDEVVAGVHEVGREMQTKAPQATIILTAIFPRNDHMTMMPVIDRINADIAHFADGKRGRYLNINNKLADGDGRLFDGMMNARDKLHPTLQGYQVWADALKPIFTE